ncbi:hypothetical protein LCGC14_2729670, partial [marine sediment metagenome]
ENGEVKLQQHGQTLSLQMGYNDSIELDVQAYFDQFYAVKLSNYRVTEDVAAGMNRFIYQGVSGNFSS